MSRSSVLGFQPSSGFSWMKITPSSKLMSDHVRCSDLTLAHPGEQNAHEQAALISVQAAKNFLSSSAVINLGSARLGSRKRSTSTAG